LTEVLLNAGYHVIVRPHYQTLLRTPEVMNRLKAKYGGLENFEYQDRMAESDTLFRSDVLICDWSAMAIEYALGLEKPVLFIDLPRRIRNPDWKAWGIEPLEASVREAAGDIVSPQYLDQVPHKIERLLGDPGAFSASMEKLRPETVFNIGNSVALGARELARLADEKSLERQNRNKAHD